MIDVISTKLLKQEYCKNYVKVLKEKLLLLLKPYTQDLSFEALLLVTNIESTDLTFTLFADKLMAYLEQIKEDRHG